jgi:hypothetical protein
MCNTTQSSEEVGRVEHTMMDKECERRVSRVCNGACARNR